MPSPRRINDAQVERLLSSLQDLTFRQRLAKKIVDKEGIKYDSAMRRLQRYVTTATEKREFARAPVAKRRIVVKVARGLPVPVGVSRFAPKPAPIPKQLELLRPSFYREIPPAPDRGSYREPEEREITLYDLRALLAYYDSDAGEAASVLQAYGAGVRTAQILELASSGADVFGIRGAGALIDAVREWFNNLRAEDYQDVQDFTDLLMNLPDWQIEMILADMEQGDSTFADWMDAWRDANMDIEEDDNEYWRLWRAAYARAKK